MNQYALKAINRTFLVSNLVMQGP